MYGTVNSDQRAWISLAIRRGNPRSLTSSKSVRGEPIEPRTDETPMFPVWSLADSAETGQSALDLNGRGTVYSDPRYTAASSSVRLRVR